MSSWIPSRWAKIAVLTLVHGGGSGSHGLSTLGSPSGDGPPRFMRSRLCQNCYGLRGAAASCNFSPCSLQLAICRAAALDCGSPPCIGLRIGGHGVPRTTFKTHDSSRLWSQTAQRKGAGAGLALPDSIYSSSRRRASASNLFLPPAAV